MTMFSKLKQFKDLRSQAKTLKNQLEQKTVHVSVKGGKVSMVMDGNQDIVAIDIDPSLLSPDKKKELEEGLKEAFADAVKKVQRLMVETMRSSGMQLPGM